MRKNEIVIGGEIAGNCVCPAKSTIVRVSDSLEENLYISIGILYDRHFRFPKLRNGITFLSKLSGYLRCIRRIHPCEHHHAPSEGYEKW